MYELEYIKDVKINRRNTKEFKVFEIVEDEFGRESKIFVGNVSGYDANTALDKFLGYED